MKYIIPLVVILFLACNSPQSDTKPVAFLQSLKMQGKGFTVVDQNGDTLIIIGKDTTVKYSYPIYTPHDTTVSYTYSVYDTTWRRKGNTQPPIPPDTTTPPPPSDFNLVYSNDFEPGTKLDPNQCGRCSISSSVVKTGQGSARFEYRKGDAQISGGYRSEQQLDGKLSPSSRDIIVEYDEYFETLPSGVQGLSMQWHGNKSGTSGSGSMWISGARFVFQNQPTGVAGSPNNYSPSLGSIQTAKWYHMRFELRWSNGSDGYMRVFIDGVKKYDVSGKNSDGGGQYPKYGINLFDGNNTVVVYYDNVRMYLK